MTVRVVPDPWGVCRFCASGLNGTDRCPVCHRSIEDDGDHPAVIDGDLMPELIDRLVADDVLRLTSDDARAEVVRRSARSIDPDATQKLTVERLLALWEELREVEEIFISELDLLALSIELANARQRRTRRAP